MNLISVICFFCLLYSPVTFGTADVWTSKYSRSLSNPVFATFWGGIRRAIHWKKHKGSLVDLKPMSFVKDLPVYIQAENKQKDLWIFYPGIFGKPDGQITPSIIDILEKKNIHVAVIPNLLAATYLVSRPAFSNNLNAEKLNQQLILKDVLARIGHKNIRNVHIVAESLGCFQALTALNANKDIHYESLTLLWPPLFLDRSLTRFDQLIEKSTSTLIKCSFWWKWPRYIYESRWQETPDLTNEDKNCLGSWVIASRFVYSIKDTAKTYFESRSLKKELPETFSQFVKSVLPDLEPLITRKDERLSVSYLLKDLTVKKIKLYSSVDDFLNVPEEWNELKKKYDVFLFPWGGHSGPLGNEQLAEQLISK